VPQLIEHFGAAAAARLQRPMFELASDALDLLCHYHWPGNVRELENLITRASVLASGKRVTESDVRPWLIDAPVLRSDLVSGESNEVACSPTVGMRLEDMERRLIESALEHFGGHRAKAAQALGIGIRTLTNKLRLYGYAPRARSFGKAA
jgi:DNA-binding NtrC family response regulator